MNQVLSKFRLLQHICSRAGIAVPLPQVLHGWKSFTSKEGSEEEGGNKGSSSSQSQSKLQPQKEAKDTEGAVNVKEEEKEGFEKILKGKVAQEVSADNKSKNRHGDVIETDKENERGKKKEEEKRDQEEIEQNADIDLKEYLLHTWLPLIALMIGMGLKIYFESYREKHDDQYHHHH